jgi:rhodanese-related sulfurtransferase
VGEERSFNPRLGGDISERDFVGYMENLGLPHPRLMDIAVPANMKCGEPAQGKAPADDPKWAPLTFTFAGIWELAPAILEEHINRVQVVDVRERDEYQGPLGHIRGSRLIPLSELPSRASELSREEPVVTVCRSGARSAQAVVMLQKAGFADVANLAGGMLRWRADGNPVESGRE